MIYVQRKWSNSKSRDNSFTNSYEEDETSSLPDESVREMQTAMDMITKDKTKAKDSYTDTYREDQTLCESMNMERIPWPMSPSRVYLTAVLPSLYENGTSSSGVVSIRPTLIENYTIIQIQWRKKQKKTQNTNKHSWSIS